MRGWLIGLGVAVGLVVLGWALRYAGRQVPRDVLIDAWPGQPRLLERLLGPASGGPAPGGPAGPAAEGQR